mgnify:FL=1
MRVKIRIIMKKGILLIVFCFCTIVSFAQNSSFLKVLKFEEEQFKLGVKLERIEASLKDPSLPFSQEQSKNLGNEMVVYYLGNNFVLSCNERANVIECYRDYPYKMTNLDICLEYLKEATDYLENKYKSKFRITTGKSIDVYKMNTKNFVITMKVGVLSSQNKVFFSISYNETPK